MRRVLTLSLLFLLPATAQASVYLNGVNVDGVLDKRFENCTVVIDAKGDVHITTQHAAGTTNTAPVAPVADAGGAPTRRYFLVTEKAAPGMTQYDIDLYINGKWVRRFLDMEEHVVMELTKYVKTGANKLTFIAKKDLGTARRSASPQHYFRVVVGEGDENGRNVMITRKAVDYKRTALETKNFQDEYVLTAQ